MPSRSLNDLHPILVDEYRAARDKFHQLFPSLPQPFVTCTYRSPAEQGALFAQSREPLARVNALRKAAGLSSITQEENKKRVTNALPGSSAHNYKPSLAFDVAFSTIDNKLDWSDSLFRKFALLMAAESKVEWGGSWQKFKDAPHFQLRNWRTYLLVPEPLIAVVATGNGSGN